MKFKATIINVSVSLVLGACLLVPVSVFAAQEILKYNCSNQVYAAFSKEQIEAFQKTTGFGVDVKTASSGSCFASLGRGYCDVASTTRKLYHRHDIYGYKEFPFCKDPIAVIARKECGVDSLTEEQLQDLFAGAITNWQEVGGADLPVMIVVPGDDTAANKNFRRQVMKHKDIEHDFIIFSEYAPQ